MYYVKGTQCYWEGITLPSNPAKQRGLGKQGI